MVMMMDMFGFSINLMTLLAMVLAIGLVVDDAIVVLENVDRHIKEGEEPFRAAIIGTGDRRARHRHDGHPGGGVCAHRPDGGITGSLFKEFALTLAGAVFVSGIIALTLSPMMCAKMLRANEEPGKFERTVHDLLDRMTARYDAMLHAVMQSASWSSCLPSSCSPACRCCSSSFRASWPRPRTKASWRCWGRPFQRQPGLHRKHHGGREQSPGRPAGDRLLPGLLGVFNSNQAFGIASMVPWSQREASQKEVLDRVPVW